MRNKTNYISSNQYQVNYSMSSLLLYEPITDYDT